MPRLHLAVLTTQERNLMFMKTDFQVLKLKFHAFSFKQLPILFINYTSRDFDNTKILVCTVFVLYLVVTPTCINVAWFMIQISLFCHKILIIKIQNKNLKSNYTFMSISAGDWKW